MTKDLTLKRVHGHWCACKWQDSRLNWHTAAGIFAVTKNHEQVIIHPNVNGFTIFKMEHLDGINFANPIRQLDTLEAFISWLSFNISNYNSPMFDPECSLEYYMNDFGWD